MSSPSPELQKSDHIYIATDSTDHQQCTCDNPKTDSIHHHCHLKSHHHVINLSHPPPTTTSHIHPIQAVHVHVHSSSPKSASKMNNSLNNSCNCHGIQDNHGMNESIVEIDQHVLTRNKIDADDRIEVSPLPPALPPRPPPRQRLDPTSINARYRARTNLNNGGGIRKYVFWCCVCGGLATILGALFLAVYFLLRSYTSTLGYFETIPTFVPATMLILTGLCVISLARRKNRYSYLIKVCGLCCLVCALTCVLVTITTTVIHMNRLQTLRECVYTQKTRTCTCYSVLLEAHANADDGVRYVFDSTPDCEVIHGALYSCLRAMFGLSVSGILVCIFSCMLVYQLLSHEKKKMYWEQLELRCRSFYQQNSSGTSSTHGSVRGPPLPSSTYCSCCDECRYPTLQGAQVFPWDSHPPPERFWTPGRVGNFYSPNPGEEIPTTSDNQRNRNVWSWRRLPWSRGNVDTNPRDNSLSTTYQGVISSADSQYGFSNRDNFHSDPASGSTGSYSILDNRPPIGGVYVWGPPPPYSNPNSPARRPIHSPSHRYHHAHHHMHNHQSHCQMSNNEGRNSRRNIRPKDNYENTTETEVHIEANETTDTSLERVSQTLPMRKMKKRNDMSSVKSTNQTSSNNTIRTNVQNVFKSLDDNPKEHDYQEPSVPDSNKTNQETPPPCRFLPRLQGVENAAFQKQESPKETTESEVYFADVSSCCNISVRNEGQDSLFYDEALDSQKPRLLSLQKHTEKEKGFQDSIISSSTATEDEDYLPQRRQLSTRRMPFPLPTSEELAEFASTSSDSRQLIPKDISQNSLTSVQTPMTESTDDGLTPVDDCSNKYFPKDNDQVNARLNYNKSDQFLAPDAQYEVIQEDFSSNLTNTISEVNSYESYDQYEENTFNYNSKNKSAIPPKSLNLNQTTTRRHIGSNISALIQNLGGNPAGLLYEEVREDEMQGHTCNSDGTMDSGWQSGSEKEKKSEDSSEASLQPQKSVNV